MLAYSQRPRRPVEITYPSSGSAYRIGGHLVLTAKHLVPSEIGSQCTVRDKDNFEAEEASVSWIDPHADIALVELPKRIPPCDPVTFGVLPTPPHEAAVRFDMYGWPQWAETQRDHRLLAGGRRLHGRINLEDTSPDGLFVLQLDRGPEIPQPGMQGSDWSGMSGAAVVCGDLVIAVQSQHANLTRARELEAVPLSLVYEREDWRHQLIDHQIDPTPTDVIARRAEWQTDHCQQVRNAIENELKSLSPTHLQKMAVAMNALRGVSDADISPEDLLGDHLPDILASCLIDVRPVQAASGFLVSLMKQDLFHDQTARLGKVMDCLLPLNYAPHILDELQTGSRGNRLLLVEGEVATRTLTEIIMAGYDGKASLFDTLSVVTRDVAGRVSLDGQEGPEEGPDSTFSVQLAARNLMFDLIELKDMVQWGQKTTLEPDRHPQQSGGELSQEALSQQLKGAAIQLCGSLASLSGAYERTLYCVMNSPVDILQRDFRREVFRVIHEFDVPLVFVELVPSYSASATEYQIKEDITFRLIHTQQGSR